MMSTQPSLIADLESAIQSGSDDKRVAMLRRITDLFVADADRLDERQIDVFNDVLEHLIQRIEGKALAELSRRLAPINNAPLGVVRRLAGHDNITIAESVLTQSTRLSDRDLIDIANTKTQAHMLAISARPKIGTTVTDVLLERGNHQVYHKLAANHGADFSESGFATLVKRSEGDDELAEKVGLRRDVPFPLFRQLLLHATEVVRSRLLASASPEARNRIQHALATVSEDEQHAAGFQNKQDYDAAYTRVLAMQSKGELSEISLLNFARSERYPDMLAGLSLLCGAPMQLVENLLQSKHREGFLVPCKAAGLDWTTVSIILSCRSVGGTLSGDDFDAARTDYMRLSQPAAARVLRFWLVRQSTVKDVAATA